MSKRTLPGPYRYQSVTLPGTEAGLPRESLTLPARRLGVSTRWYLCRSQRMIRPRARAAGILHQADRQPAGHQPVHHPGAPAGGLRQARRPQPPGTGCRPDAAQPLSEEPARSTLTRTRPACMFQPVAQTLAEALAPEDLGLLVGNRSRYGGRAGPRAVCATGWFMHRPIRVNILTCRDEVCVADHQMTADEARRECARVSARRPRTASRVVIMSSPATPTWR